MWSPDRDAGDALADRFHDTSAFMAEKICRSCAEQTNDRGGTEKEFRNEHHIHEASREIVEPATEDRQHATGYSDGGQCEDVPCYWPGN